MAVSVAQARQDPTPPPSGIVVHLFGPGSITSAVIPETASPGVPAAEPSTGDILHQMFVTGDPDAKPGSTFPKGRAGDPAN